MDPSLVRKGKKIKSEDSKISKLHESISDYDDSSYETNETDLNSNYNFTTSFSIHDQEKCNLTP